VGKIPASRVRIPPSPPRRFAAAAPPAHSYGGNHVSPMPPSSSFALATRPSPPAGPSPAPAFAHRDVKKQRILCRWPQGSRGGVAERSNAAVSKTVSGGFVRRGFKSLPLRLTKRKPAYGKELRASPLMPLASDDLRTETSRDLLKPGGPARDWRHPLVLKQASLVRGRRSPAVAGLRLDFGLGAAEGHVVLLADGPDRRQRQVDQVARLHGVSALRHEQRRVPPAMHRQET
jgi:hypothetical protein